MAPAAAVAQAAKRTQDMTSLRYRMAGAMPGEGKVTAEAAMSMKPQTMSMRTTSAKTGSTVRVRVVDKAL